MQCVCADSDTLNYRSRPRAPLRRSRSCGTRLSASLANSYLLDMIAGFRNGGMDAPVRAWDTHIRASVDFTYDSHYAHVREPISAYGHASYGAEARPRDAPAADSSSLRVEYAPDTSFEPPTEEDTSVVVHDGEDSRIPIANVLNDASDSVKRPWGSTAADAFDESHKRQRTT